MHPSEYNARVYCLTLNLLPTELVLGYTPNGRWIYRPRWQWYVGALR